MLLLTEAASLLLHDLRKLQSAKLWSLSCLESPLLLFLLIVDLQSLQILSMPWHAEMYSHSCLFPSHSRLISTVFVTMEAFSLNTRDEGAYYSNGLEHWLEGWKKQINNLLITALYNYMFWFLTKAAMCKEDWPNSVSEYLDCNVWEALQLFPQNSVLQQPIRESLMNIFQKEHFSTVIGDVAFCSFLQKQVQVLSWVYFQYSLLQKTLSRETKRSHAKFAHFGTETSQGRSNYASKSAIGCVELTRLLSLKKVCKFLVMLKIKDGEDILTSLFRRISFLWLTHFLVGAAVSKCTWKFLSEILGQRPRFGNLQFLHILM